MISTVVRASLLLLVPLLACGSSSSAPKAPGNTTPTPVAAATLADDLAAVSRASEVHSSSPWVERATFLGWTADRRAAYRLLICAEDPLGGRGDYCDLDVCVAAASSGPQVDDPSCTSAVAFELGGSFDAAAATTATAEAETALAALGLLSPGTAGVADEAGVVVENGAVLLAGDGPRRVIHAPFDDAEDESMSAKAVIATADYAGTSPDGACRVVLGRFTFLGWYEGVTGHIPRGFAAVTCD